MNQILVGKELTFKFFQNKSVSIYPLGKENLAASGVEDSQVLIIGDPLNQGPYQRAKLQGRMLDGKTGEPLPGAIVYNQETKIGVATDSKGRYSLEMPTGEMHLQISFLSFKNQSQKIRLIQNGNADFELFEKSHSLAEVTIVGDEATASKAQMSMIKITSVTIKELPVLMGEADLIKSMVMMPGVQSVGEMSSGFNVRGGNTDQNLVLLNGTPVFNTTDLFGFFSMINTEKNKGTRLIPYAFYSGTAYLNEKFAPGGIEFMDGTKVEDLKLRYSTYRDDIIYYNSAISTQIIIDKISLKGFTFIDENGVRRVFRQQYFNGFLPGGRYFELLSDGDIALLVYRYVVLQICPTYNDNAGKLFNMSYQQAYNYYLYNSKKGYELIRINKNSLLSKLDKLTQKSVKKIFRKNNVLVTDEPSFVRACNLIKENGITISY